MGDSTKDEGTNKSVEGVAPAAEKIEKANSVHNNNNNNNSSDVGITNGEEDVKRQEGGEGTKQLPKHPLQNRWCLWIMLADPGPRGGGGGLKHHWVDKQSLVHQFDTVEDFWCMYNNIHTPSHIGDADYSLFKKGIRPDWDDVKVQKGGRLIVKLPSFRASDDLWLNLSLAMIGETFDDGDCICGGVVKMRRGVAKIEVWLSEHSSPKVQSIGRTLQQVLSSAGSNIKPSIDMIFNVFETEQKYNPFKC